MIRRAATTAARRWTSEPPRPIIYYAVRCIQSGPMFEAELVSPLKKNDLEEALENHKLLLSSSSSNDDDDDDDITSNSAAAASHSKMMIQSSLEKIRNHQFQMSLWQEALETEQELHTNHYEQHNNNNNNNNKSLLDDSMAKSHNRLGILNQRLLRYKDSQVHFETSLSKYQQLHIDTFHVDIGEAWNALAALSAEQTELGQAMECLRFAEPHFRHSGQPLYSQLNPDSKPDPELRKILENQGQILRLQNQHGEALKLYREIEETLLLLPQQGGGSSSSSSSNLDRDLQLDLADCLLAIGDHDESKDLYNKVLTTLDPDTLMAAALSHQLGLIAAIQNDPAEALNYFTISHLLRQRLLGDTHLLVGKTVNAMGAVQATLDKPGAALANFREALVIYRIHTEFENDEDDPEIKQVMKNISIVQRDMEQSTFV